MIEINKNYIAVEAAVENNIIVPAEVLKDYPELFDGKKVINPERLNDHLSVSEPRKTVLPEYNNSTEIINLNAFVDKVRKLDPNNKSDKLIINMGYAYEAQVSYPNSLGEQGNYNEFWYKEKPTVADFEKDLLEFYPEKIKNLQGNELPYGGYAIGAKDENIIRELQKALDYNSNVLL